MPGDRVGLAVSLPKSNREGPEQEEGMESADLTRNHTGFTLSQVSCFGHGWGTRSRQRFKERWSPDNLKCLARSIWCSKWPGVWVDQVCVPCNNWENHASGRDRGDSHNSQSKWTFFCPGHMLSWTGLWNDYHKSGFSQKNCNARYLYIERGEL